MKALGQVYALLRRDLRAELRSPQALASMAFFAFLVIVVGSFAGLGAWVVDPGAVARGEGPARAAPVTPQTFAPAVIWIAFLFTGVLGFNRAMAREREHGALAGLLLCPVDPAVLYFGKLLGQALFLGLVELASFGPLIVFFDLRFYGRGAALLALVLLATLAFSAAGTLLASIASGVRARELVLPLILFPVLLPLFAGCVQITTWVFTGIGEAAARGWFVLLGAGTAVFLAVGMLAFEFTLED